MHCTYYAMITALQKIEGDDPLLTDAKQHLTLAVNHAKHYGDTKYSIIWKTATTVKKRSIHVELNRLAFDVYSEFMTSVSFLNEYADTFDTRPVPSWWLGMIADLHLAHLALCREHRSEIMSKQLSVFDMPSAMFPDT